MINNRGGPENWVALECSGLNQFQAAGSDGRLGGGIDYHLLLAGCTLASMGALIFTFNKDSTTYIIIYPVDESK